MEIEQRIKSQINKRDVLKRELRELFGEVGVRQLELSLKLAKDDKTITLLISGETGSLNFNI